MGFSSSSQSIERCAVVTLADKILFVILVGLTAASFLAKNVFASEGSLVIVELQGAAVFKSDLAENRKLIVNGAHGEVRIQVNGGKVAVVEAQCPNKICVRMGWRSLAGESIICVPNRVLVKILGDQSDVVRGITG
jgi:hypothetical protein